MWKEYLTAEGGGKSSGRAPIQSFLSSVTIYFEPQSTTQVKTQIKGQMEVTP